jgi:hypothetical protein
MSTAQKSGAPVGSCGSGNATRSTVTCPMRPLSYSCVEIWLQTVVRSSAGSDVDGKKQPPLTY